MLIITVGATDVFDEETQQFRKVGGTQLQLEHSLVSLSKWESKFERPFLGKDTKTPDEVVEYARSMIVGPDVPPELFHKLDETHFEAINDHINAKMTATWFADTPGAPQTREVVTSELIYYWMTVFNIPFECETWHLNRLFTLIRICNVKQSKPKKMSRAEIAQRNRQLNEQRKKQLGTSG